VKYGLEVAYGTQYGFEEAAVLMDCLRNLGPSCGKKVKEFEDAFALYCGTTHAIAVTNATSGLQLAGIAAGVGPGDEVITTPLTWVSTAMAYTSLGATVIFCDIDPKTLNMDPKTLEAKITPKTKLIVPVHLYGQCCRMDEIMAIARRHKILVAEDCAHNPGAEYKGKRSGSWGDMGVFSFHQQKNMSTLGEGGAVTMSDKVLFEKVLSYRSLCARIYGQSDKYLSIDEQAHPMGKEYWKLQFDDIGYNYRMTDAQAAVGLEQLKKLDGFNKRRKELSDRLGSRLSGIAGLTLPWVDPDGTHVWHLYVVQVEKDFPLDKTDMMWELYSGYGIKVWSNYMPIHLTKPYLERGHREGECPVAEAAFHRYVSIPMHPRLTFEAIDYVADSIRQIVAKGGGRRAG
jgi:dTDP-4-amino-4,6-dideoxygalactose transaminase